MSDPLSALNSLLAPDDPPDPTHARIEVVDATLDRAGTLGVNNKDDLAFTLEFNPVKLTLQRSPNWGSSHRAYSDHSLLHFADGGVDQLSFDFWLDDSEDTAAPDALPNPFMMFVPRPDADWKEALGLEHLEAVADLEAYRLGLHRRTGITWPLTQLLLLTKTAVTVQIEKQDPGAARPPVVHFCFGEISFVGVVDNLQIDVVLFDDSGIPLRANVQMTLKGIAQASPSLTPLALFTADKKESIESDNKAQADTAKNNASSTV